MDTKTVISVVAALIVIGGGAWYFSTQQQAPADTGEQGSTTTEGSGTATFAALLAAGGSRSCDVLVANEESPATGVVYVSGTDVRSDFTAKPAIMNGAEVTAHMIQTGGYIYSWTDLVPQGVKVKTDAAASTGQSMSSAIDPNAEVQYDCSVWVPDASKFEVPDSITFMEFGNPGPK